MNYDISTAEGMKNSANWLQTNIIDKDGASVGHAHSHGQDQSSGNGDCTGGT